MRTIEIVLSLGTTGWLCGLTKRNVWLHVLELTTEVIAMLADWLRKAKAYTVRCRPSVWLEESAIAAPWVFHRLRVSESRDHFSVAVTAHRRVAHRLARQRVVKRHTVPHRIHTVIVLVDWLLTLVLVLAAVP